MEIHYRLPPERIPYIPHREGEAADEFEERLVEASIKAAVGMVEELASYDDLEKLGYHIVDDSPPIPFDSLIGSVR